MRPFIHNAKVIWIASGKHWDVYECYDVPYGIAQRYVRNNKTNPQYAGGKLKVVSMLQKKFKLRYN